MGQYFDSKGNPIQIEEPKTQLNPIYYDAKGNPINVNQPRSESPVRITNVGSPKLEVPPVDYEHEQFDKSWLKPQQNNQHWEDSLPLGLGLLGSLAGPVGFGTGSFSGELLKRMVKNGGIPSSSDVGMSALSAAPDFAIPALGEAAATTKPILRAKLARMLFSGNQTAGREAALSAVPDANPSVGQMTGSRTANMMENWLAPNASSKLKNSNSPALEAIFNKLTPGTAESRAGNIRDAVEAGMNNLKSDIGVADTGLKGLANHNTVKYDIYKGQTGTGMYDHNNREIMKDVVDSKSVAGPVYFKNGALDAEAFLEGMRKKYGAKSNVDLVPLVPEAQQQLVKYAQNIADTKFDPTQQIQNWQGPVGNGLKANGVHPVDLQTALDWKTATGDKGYAKELGGDNTQRLWKNLNKSISEDLKESIPNWQGGSQAADLYKTRNDLNSSLHNLYLDRSPGNKNLMLSDGKTSGVKNVNSVLTDPTQIDKTISGSSNPNQTRSDLLGSWVEKVYSRASSFDPNTQAVKFNASGPMSEFLDPKNKEILDRLVPKPADRENLGNFFKSVSILHPGESGSNYLAMRLARGATTVVLPTLVGAGGGVGLGVATGTAEVGLNQFVKKVLLNPEVARLIPRLSSLPTSSPEGRAISRLVFTALKGTELNLTNPQGEKTGSAIVGPSGQLTPKQ